MTAIAIHQSSTIRAIKWAGIALALSLNLTNSKLAEPAAASNSSPVTSPAPKAPAAPKASHHWYQLGHASWYGQYFQGRTTASGETYNMYDLTCAHRSLPLGSLVKVTNLRNHKTIVLRVNDRGPVPDDRIVDLSYAAANFLGVSGIARVRLDLLPAVATLHWPDASGQ